MTTTQPKTMHPILLFMQNNPSITMIFVAEALAAGPAEPGLWSGIVHAVNLACLFGIRKTAKDLKYVGLTGVLFFLVIISALVQDRFTPWSYLFQGMSAAVTLYMWWYVWSGRDAAAGTVVPPIPDGDMNT